MQNFQKASTKTNTMSISVRGGTKPSAHFIAGSIGSSSADWRTKQGALSQKIQNKKPAAKKVKSDDDSDDSAPLYIDKFKRPCCQHGKIDDHTQPRWKPNFTWLRNEVKQPLDSNGQSKGEQPGYIRKVKNLRSF